MVGCVRGEVPLCAGFASEVLCAGQKADWLQWCRKQLRPIDPIGRIVGRFYHTNPSIAQRTIEDIGAVLWAFHPALHSAFWGEPASSNILGHQPILIAGILHALRWRSSITSSMRNEPMHPHILTMPTSDLDLGLVAR